MIKMKKVIYLLTLIVTISIISCGEPESENKIDKVPIVNTKGLEELDLSEYGYNLSIMVPRADMNGVADVKLSERGTLEIVIGLDYGLEIMFGDGDLELLKTDLRDGLVFDSEILKEDKNTLVYTQFIPDSGVKIQNHFMHVFKAGDNVYEIRDIVAREYGSGMIEKMLQSARTIKVLNLDNVPV